MVFQNYALFPHMTIAENLAFPLQVRKIEKQETEERVKRALDMVQLGALGGRRPAQQFDGDPAGGSGCVGPAPRLVPGCIGAGLAAIQSRPAPACQNRCLSPLSRDRNAIAKLD